MLLAEWFSSLVQSVRMQSSWDHPLIVCKKTVDDSIKESFLCLERIAYTK
uniref:Uncharacterized protein n=1 Tax=Arundo donax TaxID=35708 RepID=A0A0A9BD41_ARUDO